MVQGLGIRLQGNNLHGQGRPASVWLNGSYEDSAR